MLKIIKIFIVLVSIAMVSPSHADQWAITYGGISNEYLGANGYVRQTSDGGFIMSGFTRSFGAGSEDMWIVKLNQDGTIAWQKTYGGISNDTQAMITPKEDGGYIVGGHTNTFGAGSHDWWVLELNPDGTIAWQKAYGGSATDYGCYPIPTTDGGYIVAASTPSFGVGSNDAWILKLDNTGSIEWEKTYGGSGNDGVQCIIHTLDGGYIAAGSTTSFGAGSYDYWILKIGKDGSVVWQKTYGGTGDDRGTFIRPTSDGGHIVAGNATSFGVGSSDIWLLKLSNNGSIEWQKSYGGVDLEFTDGDTFQETSDGGYIFGGNTRSFGAGKNDLLLLKLNEIGEVSWQKTYGGSENETIHSVQQILDGGYIIGGDTESFGAGGSDWFPLKLNENGDIPGCEFISDVNVTVTNTNAIVQNTNVVPQDSSAIVTDTNVVPHDTNVEPNIICYFSGLEQSEIIGTWSSGIWYWDVATSSWTQMYSGLPSAALAAGDFTDDGKADVASIWSSGLWFQDGDTLGWTQVYHTAPDRIAAGDITGDGVDEIIGCGGAWSSGVWYRDVANGTWHHPWSGAPDASMAGDHPINDTPDGPIAAGDVTGDGKADMVSCWDSGLWYQDGATLAWTKVWKTAPYKVTCGDVTGDKQAEIISTWDSGIWYWDVAASKWTKMYSFNPDIGLPFGDIATGDFTGDGKADVASCWSDGLWYQNGATLGWEKVCSETPYHLTAGDVTGD